MPIRKVDGTPGLLTQENQFEAFTPAEVRTEALKEWLIVPSEASNVVLDKTFSGFGFVERRVNEIIFLLPV